MSDHPLFAAPDAAAHGTSAGGALEITVALALIVGLIVALAWFTRRMRGGSVRGGAGRIQVLSSTALGVKERAVLVRVGETDILVGVAPGAVHTLHVFQKGESTEAPPAPASSAPNFKDLLMKALGK